MRFLRSLFVWLGIAASTAGFGLPAILAAFVPPRGDWFLRFARGWARTILAFSRVAVTVRHAERLDPRRSFVVVANHESYADILVLLARLPMQVRFLAKRSIFRVPILGWSIRAAGFVPVDRGDAARSVATVETALKRLRSGRSLVVFPEETRTRTGDLSPFKKGAALLALKAGSSAAARRDRGLATGASSRRLEHDARPGRPRGRRADRGRRAIDSRAGPADA